MLGLIDCDWNKTINNVAFLIRLGIDVHRALIGAVDFAMQGTLPEICKREITLRFEHFLPQDFVERYIPRTMEEGVKALAKSRNPVLEYILKTYDSNRDIVRVFGPLFIDDDVVEREGCLEFCGKIARNVLDDYECFDVYGNKC